MIFKAEWLRRMAVVVFVAAAAPAAALAPADKTPPQNEISNFLLNNGMEVVVIPDRRAPIVTHMVWYKVGSADELPGKSGIAHFFEHLMFKGTEKHKAGEFGARIAEIGGSENAFTSDDYTAYFQTVPPDALETMIRQLRRRPSAPRTSLSREGTRCHEMRATCRLPSPRVDC